MDRDDLDFCAECAKPILAEWKGWPHKDAIPLLPKLSDGVCAKCSGGHALKSDHIFWHNIHGPYSTGLPDYWVLELKDVGTSWGSPYFSEGKCPKCEALSVISEMNYPNGKHELKGNCPECGVSSPP